MNERVETTLRWMGDLPWWIGVPLALVVAVAGLIFYRRDVHGMTWWMRSLLPILRASTVFMIVVMLSGPVLHHRKTIGQLAKLWVFLDGSQSMALTDASMDTGRKVLILQRLGLLKPDAVKTDLPKAVESLAEAQGAAERALSIAAIEPDQWKQLTDEFAARVEEARSFLSGVIETERDDRLKRELLDGVKLVAKASLVQIDTRNQALKDFSQLGDKARRWQTELRELFDKSLGPQLSDSASPLNQALTDFESRPRWQRVQSLLLEGEGEKKVLNRLAQNYEVQLVMLDGHGSKMVWQPTARASSAPQALPQPASDFTDLAAGLRSGVEAQSNEQRGAVIVFSDGQHNDGESPVEAAKVLGGKGTPIFPIGIGSNVRPRDIAIIKAGGPESVFHEERYRGEVILKDDVPVGQAFTITIRDGETVVWEQKLLSENKPLRRVPFDFSVKELAEPRQRALASTVTGADVTGFPIELKVSVSPAEGERELKNNEGSLRFRAITQKRRILIVDGRARWETRYLRNMFERDEQWEVNTVIAGSRNRENGFSRGDKPEQFPREQSLLDTYDLIFFGEVQRSAWEGEELRWIREFVEKRGGAVVFIDGARGYLTDYNDTPIGPLFPIEFKGGTGLREGISRVLLTERATQIAAFALAPEREANVDTWSKLKAPHWLANVSPLPGAESLIEAEVNGQRAPAAVARPFGAGKVYYQGFDDSWRWRYEVADLWHVKFWNQIANFTAEPPFSVRDKFVSLDAGGVTYQPGQAADLRVRLRDGEGRPVSNATVDAVLLRDGQKMATIRLSADETGSGLFRGRTAPLESGSYEVAVESAAIPESQLKARTSFKVEPRETGELTQLAMNEDLLRQMATASGGRYLREENFD
ncbi:MAG TPA: hypothetical protein VFG14_01615, partial [Chthoniobacteraceae bacterium]|nr:hypothetical protein [Chthoniobacteraceae bacterium]